MVVLEAIENIFKTSIIIITSPLKQWGRCWQYVWSVLEDFSMLNCLWTPQFAGILFLFLPSWVSKQRAEHFSDEGIPQRYLNSQCGDAAAGSVDGLVINALFTHTSCCLLLWLGLIKGEILLRRQFLNMAAVKDFQLRTFILFFRNFCRLTRSGKNTIRTTASSISS